jgi:hypothetical protein
MPLYLGRTHVGMQGGDILRMLDFLQQRADITTISIASYHNMASAVLHAVAGTGAHVARVAILDSISSYLAVASARYYDMPHWMEMYGPLAFYDLPDLAAALAPRPLLIAFPTDELQRPLPDADAKSTYDFTAATYAKMGAQGNFLLTPGTFSDGAAVSAMLQWLSVSS